LAAVVKDAREARKLVQIRMPFRQHVGHGPALIVRQTVKTLHGVFLHGLRATARTLDPCPLSRAEPARIAAVDLLRFAPEKIGIEVRVGL
jgi:hypothetical protein